MSTDEKKCGKTNSAVACLHGGVRFVAFLYRICARGQTWGNRRFIFNAVATDGGRADFGWRGVFYNLVFIKKEKAYAKHEF